MSDLSACMCTIDSLIDAVSNAETSIENENSSTTSLNTNALTELPSQTEIHVPTDVNIEQQQQRSSTSEPTLINITDLNFDLNTKWKIRGVITFKYDMRQFNNEYGDGEIFSFDIQDNTGEITVVSFNLSSRSLNERIEKQKAYEITGLFIKTASEIYKTLPNKLQLTSTPQTVVTETISMSIPPLPYVFVKLQNLDELEINSVIGTRSLSSMDNTIIRAEEIK